MHTFPCIRSLQARERAELGEFTAQEHQLLMEQEHSLTAEAAQWQADATAAAAQLGDARQRLVAADGALQQRDEEAGQLRGELEAAQAAAAAAAGVTAEWRQRAEQYDKDRQAAASNIRKAEHELSLVAADNERMFRQVGAAVSFKECPGGCLLDFALTLQLPAKPPSECIHSHSSIPPPLFSSLHRSSTLCARG